MTVVSREKAQDVVNSLGMALYHRADGRLYQHPPGERFEPPVIKQLSAHGTRLGEIAYTSGSPVGSAADPVGNNIP
jgi:hypothetical protein